MNLMWTVEPFMHEAVESTHHIQQTKCFAGTFNLSDKPIVNHPF